MTRHTTNGAAPDAGQLALDLADANLRLDRVRRAILAKQQLEEEVARLTLALRNARRKLKEAGWALGTLLRSEGGQGGEQPCRQS